MFQTQMERRDKCKSLLWVCLLMENPCRVASWRLQVDSHTVCHVSQLSSSPAPVFSHSAPPSDIMGRSKVTHIYPIKRDFEKTNIRLQLMLQWGPESERCYRLKRLGFQSPANKRQSSPLREKETEWMGAMGRGQHVESESTLWNSSVGGASVSRWCLCVSDIVLWLFSGAAADAYVDVFHVDARRFSLVSKGRFIFRRRTHTHMSQFYSEMRI